MKKSYNFEEYIKLEQNVINDLLIFYDKNLDYNKIIYTDWTAKDLLAHIVTWHESFANNIMDIINGNELKLLKGKLYEINENGVNILKNNSIDELKKKLAKYQEIIIKNIGNEKINLIPYRKESKRYYTKEEHIEIVYKHIKGHYDDLIKKYKIMGYAPT